MTSGGPPVQESRPPVPAGFLLFLLLAAACAASADEPSAEGATGYASVNYFLPEGDADIVQPTVFGDRGPLHLEARYNYEGRDTGSLWAGINLSGGDDVAADFTPMLGLVFGSASGIAPGYRLSLGWRDIGLYSEAEYVFDADDSDDDFFYTWTELTVSPSGAWRTGLVIQRTKTYEAPFDVQRGLLFGMHAGRFDVTAYVLNPDETPVYVLAAGAAF